MDTFNIDVLKVGDTVGYARFYGWNSFTGGTAKITKINRHRHITLDTGRIFDKHGTERNALGSGLRLYSATYIIEGHALLAARHEKNKQYNLLLTAR